MSVDLGFIISNRHC